MSGSTSFETWAQDCPLKDSGQCVKLGRACKRHRCPRLDVFKGWRINEKERQKPKKWW